MTPIDDDILHDILADQKDQRKRRRRRGGRSSCCPDSTPAPHWWNGFRWRHRIAASASVVRRLSPHPGPSIVLLLLLPVFVLVQSVWCPEFVFVSGPVLGSFHGEHHLRQTATAEASLWWWRPAARLQLICDSIISRTHIVKLSARLRSARQLPFIFLSNSYNKYPNSSTVVQIPFYCNLRLNVR